MLLFKNKILLITGGTGSIGRALLDRLLETDIKEIRVFSRDEKKQDDLRCQLRDPKLKFYLGDVRDKKSLDIAMRKVDYVFHAAALKQVSSCEYFPMEAVQTNILGAENVLNSAVENGVEKIVMLSTDKAVYPTSSMGVSKAMMEKIMLAKSSQIENYQKTIICGTRFGNVMASRGSVIIRFIEQIKAGQNLNVTNPNMTRFMMSVEEAVELILYTFQHAVNGDIFIREAPIIKLGLLAKALLEIYNSNICINITGTHSGEKESEALLSKEEITKAEKIESYIRIPRDFVQKGNLENSTLFPQSLDMHLNLEETKELLLRLDFVQKNIGL